MTVSLFTKLAALIWPDATQTDKAEVRTWGLEVETALNALISNPVLINGKLVISVAGNVLTVALKTLANANPSASDPVYAVFRHATASDGDQAVLKLTAAYSLTVSAGSTLGGFTQGRLLPLAFNDGGTFRLAIFNPYASGVRYPLPLHGIASATSEGGAGAADSAGVIYAGAAISSKAFVILGSLNWITALASTGLWSAAPDVVKPWSPGDLQPHAQAPGFLHGLTLSNNGSDANNDIDIAAGACMADADLGAMFLTSTLTKRSDAAWAVGTGNGGMDTGAKTTSQWLYLWLIERSDTGVVDALFSASATAPTMPTGYDKKRRIGSVRTDGSSNFLAFIQDGDEFTFKVPITDLASTANPGTAAVLRTLTVPPSMWARFTYWLNNVTTAAVAVLVTETAQTDTTPATAGPFDLRATAAAQVVEDEFRRKVDSSSQIRTRQHASGAADAVMIVTKGFTDTRGRLA